MRDVKKINKFIKDNQIKKIYFSDNELEDNNFNYIQTKNGYSTYIKIKSKYLLSHEKEEDILDQINIFHMLLFNIENDFQIYKIDKEIDFKEKLEWLGILINNHQIEAYKEYLEIEKLKIKKYEEEGYKEKLYFFKINAPTLDNLVNIISSLCPSNNEIGQSIGVFGSMYFELISNVDFMYILNYFMDSYLDVDIYDNHYINNENNTYCRFMTINNFENKQRLRWLINLFNEYEIDCFLSIKAIKRDKSLDLLSRSLRELNDRSDFEGTYRSAIESELKSADLINFLSNISESFESILEVEIKIKISGKDIEELDKKEKLINQTYKGSFEITSNLYEVEKDIFKVLAFKKVKYDLSSLIPSTSFAASLPFDFNISNDNGGFLKYISDNSVVFLDPFIIKGQRKSFDYLVIGKKGSGKSVDLKTMIVEHGAKSTLNKVFSLDLDREFIALTEYLGGINVSVGGDNTNYINPLQIIQLENNSNNISLYLSFLEIFISFLFPSIKEKDMIDLSQIIALSYKAKGVNPFNNLELNQSEYPILEDISNLIKLLLNGNEHIIKDMLDENLANNLDDLKAKYQRLIQKVKTNKEVDALKVKYAQSIKVLKNYYKYNLTIDEEVKEKLKNINKYYIEQIILQYPFFNKHTTIKLDSHLINFDVSLLKDTPKLYGAQIVLILNFFNNTIRKNKNYVHTFKTLDSKLIYLEEQAKNFNIDISEEIKEIENVDNEIVQNILLNDIVSQIEKYRPHIRTIFDEFHRIIDNPKALNFLIKSVLEGRKYSSGIALATQSFKHIFDNENSKDMMILYDELTYKLFLHQDKTAVSYIDDKIELTPSTKQRIVEASKGEGILIVNSQTYHYKNEQTLKWLEIYGGGR